MTLADALSVATHSPTPQTMGALFDALVLVSDEEYLTFWEQMDGAPFKGALRRSVVAARGKTDRARSITKAHASLSR